MTHTFYIQDASRRSAQSFPITLAPGAKFCDAKNDFAGMLGTPVEQVREQSVVSLVAYIFSS
jgi:hypothetical protein